ncbi:MAG: hypothetical protein IJU45_03885 [Clostridia bacterium]|nr:hypothetical protein [Clostridia bacterium]
MDNINDIISSLSAEDIDSLKSMAQSIFGGEEKEEHFSKPENQPGVGTGFSPEIMMKLSALINKINGSSDSGRYKLIEALKPNLTKERQKKADEAMHIMKVLDILPMITELISGGETSADK